MKYTISILLLGLIFTPLFAAIGCDLNDPDRDVRRLFPESTGYRAFYRSVDNIGGTELLQVIEERLGDKFTGMYETIDVPYTVYEIHRGEDIIGYIHGGNQRGLYGGLQVFLALDPELKILDFYIQRLRSRNARQYRSTGFAGQFAGLTIEDFAKIDVLTGKGEGRATRINNPAPTDDPDFLSILRAVKKNLILMEYFIAE